MKNRIKVYRAMHDLTQEGLAIEEGKYDPSIDLAFKVARCFGVTVEDIFIYDDTGRQK